MLVFQFLTLKNSFNFFMIWILVGNIFSYTSGLSCYTCVFEDHGDIRTGPGKQYVDLYNKKCIHPKRDKAPTEQCVYDTQTCEKTTNLIEEYGYRYNVLMRSCTDPVAAHPDPNGCFPTPTVNVSQTNRGPVQVSSFVAGPYKTSTTQTGQRQERGQVTSTGTTCYCNTADLCNSDGGVDSSLATENSAKQFQPLSKIQILIYLLLTILITTFNFN